MSREVDAVLQGLDPALQEMIRSALLPDIEEKERRIEQGIFDDSGIRAKANEITSTIESDFSHYQDDPVGFVEKEFGEYVPPDCAELMEAVRDYPAVIAKSANATGKSWSAARIAAWFLLSHPGAKVYTAAAPPESNLRNILWAEIGSILQKHKTTKFRNFRINTLQATHKGNSTYFLTGVTIPTAGPASKREAAFSGKHAPYMLFILDEADGIPPEVYKGIESCLSGGIKLRFLMMFNPRHESGPVYLAERDKKAHVVTLTAFTHPNVVTGINKVPGAVTREKTIQRINEWTVPLAEGEKPDAECFSTVQECPFLVGTTTKSLAGDDYPALPDGWRRIINPQFSYMVLGQYPAAAEGQLISRAWIKQARDRWDNWVAKRGLKPPFGIAPIQGLDVAEGGPDSNVSCLRYGDFVLPLVSWGDIDTNQTAHRAAEIHAQYRCLRTCVDGNGFGAGVAPRMVELGDEWDSPIEAYGVKVQVKPTYEVEEGEFRRMRDQLWWFTRIWLRHNPNAMLPPDPELEEELATPTYIVDRGKIIVMDKKEMKEKLRRSPDRAEALILTFNAETVEQEDLLGPLGYAIFKHTGK